jgi:hypothetical protein
MADVTNVTSAFLFLIKISVTYNCIKLLLDHQYFLVKYRGCSIMSRQVYETNESVRSEIHKKAIQCEVVAVTGRLMGSASSYFSKQFEVKRVYPA